MAKLVYALRPIHYYYYFFLCFEIQAMQMHHSIFGKSKTQSIKSDPVSLWLLFGLFGFIVATRFWIWNFNEHNFSVLVNASYKIFQMTYDWHIKMCPKATKSGKRVMHKFYSLVELFVCGWNWELGVSTSYINRIATGYWESITEWISPWTVFSRCACDMIYWAFERNILTFN